MDAKEHAAGVREPSGPPAGAQAADDGARERLDAALAPADPGEHGAPADGPAAAAPGQDASGEIDELVALAEARDQYLALAQRTQADFENYRKRVARDAAASETRGLVRLARELLPSIDNLDRALAHADDADTDPVLIDGLRLVRRELLGALERVGIEAFGAPGERFDPEHHEAVAQQPLDGREAGEVAEVYQPGYRLAAGGLVRPARVLVAG